MGQVTFYVATDGAEITISMHPHKAPRDDLSWAEWQRLSYDRHSLVADPLFTDAVHDDYSLRAESPALRLGFVPIDLSKIGPREKGIGQ